MGHQHEKRFADRASWNAFTAEETCGGPLERDHLICGKSPLDIPGWHGLATDIPTLAEVIMKNANPLINLEGMAVGNGCWGSGENLYCGFGKEQKRLEAEFLHGHGFFSAAMKKQLDEACAWTPGTVSPISDRCAKVLELVGARSPHRAGNGPDDVGTSEYVYDQCGYNPQVSHGLQLQSLWAIPTAAVSQHVRLQPSVGRRRPHASGLPAHGRGARDRHFTAAAAVSTAAPRRRGSCGWERERGRRWFRAARGGADVVWCPGSRSAHLECAPRRRGRDAHEALRGQLPEVSHGLQLHPLWIIPTAAVSR